MRIKSAVSQSKVVVNNLMSKIGYQIAKTNKIHFDPVIDNDSKFVEIYNKIKPYTMTSKVQCFSLYNAVKYVISAKIPGDFVECGVWRGGNTMLIAYTLQSLSITNRKIFLYDTYEGMAEPTELDYSIEDITIKANQEWSKKQNKNQNDWCYASLEDVQKNMTGTGYPDANLVYVKGKVEDTIPKTISNEISILRLDTDWYDSTKHELSHLYPLVSKGGVLMIDDYGTWSGSKKAVDEFFAECPVLLNRIDVGNRLVIKT